MLEQDDVKERFVLAHGYRFPVGSLALADFWACGEAKNQYERIWRGIATHSMHGSWSAERDWRDRAQKPPQVHPSRN